jgi:hypothetical protein
MMNRRLVSVMQSPPNAGDGAEKQGANQYPSLRFPKPNRPDNHESQRQQPDSHQNEHDSQNEGQKRNHSVEKASAPPDENTGRALSW